MHGIASHPTRNARAAWKPAALPVAACVLALLHAGAGLAQGPRPSPLAAGPAAPLSAPAAGLALPAPPAQPAPPDDPKALEEKYLLPLLAQERALLQNFGPDHPDVRDVRARIEVTADWIQRQPKREPAQPPAPPAIHVELAQPPAQPAIHVAVAQPPVQPAFHVEVPAPVVMPAPVVVPPPPAPLPAPVVEKALDLPPPAAAAPPAAPAPAPAPPAHDTIVKVLVQLVSILAALVVVLLVQLVALLVILRRFAGKLTPQVRVEVVSAGTPSAQAPGEVLAQRIYLDAPTSPRQTGEAPMPTSLGPDYADQLAAEQDAAREQDAAVFKQIFEDNARLREQLETM